MKLHIFSDGDAQMPDWAQGLCEAISATVEFKGASAMVAHYAAPDENEWEAELIEIAPARMEIEEAGPNDGEQIYGIIHNLDLLTVQDQFDEVQALSFGFENDGQPIITVEGLYGGRDVVVLINLFPFDSTGGDDEDGDDDEDDDVIDDLEDDLGDLGDVGQ
jgi:hypothetical protein